MESPNLGTYLKLKHLRLLDDEELSLYQLPEAGESLESLQRRADPELREMVDEAYEYFRFIKGGHNESKKSVQLTS